MLCPRSTLLVMLNLDNKSDHSVDFYCLRGQASPLMLEFWCIHFPKSSSFYFYPVQDKVLCQQDRMNFIRESEIFSNSYTEATSFLFHTPSCKGVIQLKLTSRIRCVAHCCCCKQNFIGIPPCSFIYSLSRLLSRDNSSVVQLERMPCSPHSLQYLHLALYRSLLLF